ncbi:MAG: glycogen debranching protein GlgX [Myxococcota bacterium]
MNVWPGSAYPLGATVDEGGTNFAIASSVAERVELLLLGEAERALTLPSRTGDIWHGYVPGVGAGQHYAYRVFGPHDPWAGDRCDPSLRLLDPYARTILGDISVVEKDDFDWGDHTPPKTPLADSVIYEVHVKGFTRLHPEVPTELRGTYGGLAHPSVISHLQSLGITAVELLPAMQFRHETFLLRKGLRNHWGYATVGFFAPHEEYAAVRGEQVTEFKRMVQALHRAGIEVILDVVFNHSGEGHSLEPTTVFRGIDNAAYYRLRPEDRARYLDVTGTGNTLDVRHPFVFQLVMDSLRYWRNVMRVDGFRFDLAPALSRDRELPEANAALMRAIEQEPALQGAKLIAEPWDVGPGGYRLGTYSPRWSEWNDQYRDTVRDFWRGHGTLATFARRITGSDDHFGARGPAASINFVTAHDGFTLRDLVSYETKHNEANLEGNRDGHGDNRSSNYGVEGDTGDEAILAVRARQQRNLLATLLLSQGVPMLLAGDELGRTQRGNNNAYCQDNELSWVHWDAVDEALLRDVRALVAIRRAHPVFRRATFFQGEVDGGVDVAWLRPDGSGLTDGDWHDPERRALMLVLSGALTDRVTLRGDPMRDANFVWMINAGIEAQAFRLPAGEWEHVFTSCAVTPGAEVTLEGRSMVLWRSPSNSPSRERSA